MLSPDGRVLACDEGEAKTKIEVEVEASRVCGWYARCSGRARMDFGEGWYEMRCEVQDPEPEEQA